MFRFSQTTRNSRKFSLRCTQFDLNYNEHKYQLLNKIRQKAIILENISDTKDGIIQSKIGDILFLTSPSHHECKKLLVGEDVNRYRITFASRWVDYRPDEMMAIEKKRGGGGLRLRTRNIFERKKILTRQTADRIIAAYDDNSYYYANTLHGTAVTNTAFDTLFVLGVLNSKLTTWYYRSYSDETGKAFAQVKIELLRKLPIPNVNKNYQQPITNLVRSIIEIKRDNPNALTESIENQIDQFIYHLYDLSADEIGIIEKMGSK